MIHRSSRRFAERLEPYSLMNRHALTASLLLASLYPGALTSALGQARGSLHSLGGSSDVPTTAGAGDTNRLLSESSWHFIAPMSVAREYCSGIGLTDGSVLVAGGIGADGTGNFSPFASTEVYSPTTGTWSSGGPLGVPRWAFGLAALPSGRILACGGRSFGVPSQASAEIYDPPSRTWMPAGTMSTARAGHTTVKLLDGRVLVAGGFDLTQSPGSLSGTEIFDESTSTWMISGSMNRTRYDAAAVVLLDGRVLVCGGISTDGFTNTAEVFDPALGTWRYVSSMHAARELHAACLLSDGRVLVAGGDSSTDILDSAEIYDPQTDTWRSAGSMGKRRTALSLTRLESGNVLATGGVPLATPVAASDIYHPQSDTWTSDATPNTERSGHVAALLTDGDVLVAGGSSYYGFGVASAEVYSPARCELSCRTDMVVAAGGATSTNVIYSQPETDGPCGGVICSPPSGSAFPLGTTTVQCSAAGTSCSFTVTVVVGDQPVISAVRLASGAGGKPQLVIDGENFSEAPRVAIDGVAFIKPPRATATRIRQQGKLVDGRSLRRALPSGHRVMIRVENPNGAFAEVQFEP